MKLYSAALVFLWLVDVFVEPLSSILSPKMSILFVCLRGTCWPSVCVECGAMVYIQESMRQVEIILHKDFINFIS